MDCDSPLQKIKILSLPWRLNEPKSLKNVRRIGILVAGLFGYKLGMTIPNSSTTMQREDELVTLSGRCRMRMDVLLTPFTNWLILVRPISKIYSRLLLGPLLLISSKFPESSLDFLTKKRNMTSLSQYPWGNWKAHLNGLKKIKSLARMDGQLNFICLSLRPLERIYLRLWRSVGHLVDFMSPSTPLSLPSSPKWTPHFLSMILDPSPFAIASIILFPKSSLID